MGAPFSNGPVPFKSQNGEPNIFGIQKLSSTDLTRSDFLGLGMESDNPARSFGGIEPNIAAYQSTRQLMNLAEANRFGGSLLLSGLQAGYNNHEQISNVPQSFFGTFLTEPIRADEMSPFNIQADMYSPRFIPPLSARRTLLGESSESFIGTGRSYSSIHLAFEETLSRIELDATRIDSAKRHYNAIKTWLESRLNVEVRRVGSFRKHTKIRPTIKDGVATPLDIDARVCFGDVTHFVPSDQGIRGESLLHLLRGALALNKTYRLMEPIIDKPTVTLQYANEFSIELTPCFRNRMPPHNWNRVPVSFLLCNGAGQWESTDYDYDSAFMSKANSFCDGNLIPSIKLMKQFVRNRKIPLKSFQVELLCLKAVPHFFATVLDTSKRWEWQDLLTFIFNFSPFLLGEKLSIPGSLTQFPPVECAVEASHVLENYAGVASELVKCGDSADAYRIWSLIFGSPFPKCVDR